MNGADKAIEDMQEHAAQERLKKETHEITSKLHQAIAGHSHAAVITAVSCFVLSAPSVLGLAIRAALGIDDRRLPDMDRTNETLRVFLEKL